jgi:transposase
MARSAGVDWASEAHEVCVVDGGEVIYREEVPHDERGIAYLCRKLVELEVQRVAIERPEGVLVERLLDAGLRVLAELARTDAHRFRALVPDSDRTKALRALTRSREELVSVRVELANQLSAQLEAFWPGAARLFGSVDSKIALAFLGRYPSPADARGLGEKRMAAFLAREGYSGNKSAAELVGRLRGAPSGDAGEAELCARRAVVLGLVDALAPLVEQIAELTRRIGAALAEHPDREIFAPLFRSASTVICPATLIAEIGDVRGRYPTEASLAADAGQSPVAVESGKRRVAVFRRACDKRLRGAVATLANSTRQWHPWAQDIYRRARERGADHPHAIRILGRAWVRVLWRCWVDEMPYDPALHGGLSRLQPSGG